jgi:DNA-binding CsgD family transcriptional regulator
MKLKGADVLLSEREAQVARLLCAGLGNAEVAGELKISENTASVHIRNMLRGLGLQTRAQLAIWCLQHPEAILLRDWSDYRAHPLDCECLTLPYCAWRRLQGVVLPLLAA